MLELRQDLIASREWRTQVIEQVVPVLEDHFSA
jgi:hypothetical protein